MEERQQEPAIRFFARHNHLMTVILLLAIFIAATAVALNGQSGSVSAEMDDNWLGVIGPGGAPIFVALEEITQVRLADAVDFGKRLEGEEAKTTRSGRYENDVFGVYTLCVYPDSAPYIVVTYGEGETLVFNLKKTKQTQEIYEDLTRRSV